MDFFLAENKTKKLTYLIVAHLLILLGYSFNKGLFFHQAQLWLLLLGWLVLFLPFFKKDFISFNFDLKPANLLLAANLVSFILFYFFDGGIYLSSAQATSNIILLKFTALILFLFYFVNFNFKGKNFFSVVITHFSKRKFIYLVLLALILRLTTIFYSPTPKIDVFLVLTQSADALLKGSNPYSEEFFNVYSPEECVINYGIKDCKNDSAAYLPGTFLLVTPFKMIFGDIRFAYIFSIFGSAAIIYFLLKKKFPQLLVVAELAALLLLYLPLGLFVLEQSWVDTLPVFLIYLFTFLILAGYQYLPYLIFGLFLATKQTMVLFFPFLLLLKGLNWQKIALAIFIPAIIIVPFAIWNFNDFIYDVLLNHLNYKEALHSLSFTTINKIYFYNLIPYQLLILFVLALLFLFLFLKSIKGKRDLPSVINSFVVFSLATFLLKRGFTHYYDSTSALVILLIVLELYQNPELLAKKLIL